MQKKIYHKNNQTIRIFITLLFLISVLFIALNSDFRNPEIFSDNPLGTDLAITSTDAARDLVYTGSSKTTVSKESISKRTAYGKVSFDRNGFGAAFVCTLSAAAFVYTIVRRVSFGEVLSTLRFIISYIHDLDGMKS